MYDSIYTATETDFTCIVAVYLFDGEKPTLTNSEMPWRLCSVLEDKIPTDFFNYEIRDLVIAIKGGHTDFTLYRENLETISVKIDIVGIGKNDYLVRLQATKKGGVKNGSKKN